MSSPFVRVIRPRFLSLAQRGGGTLIVFRFSAHKPSILASAGL
jgi:hypothetical protein